MRPIDADADISYIKTWYCTDCNSYNGVRCRACNFDDAMSAIDDTPTLDVEPVRHGRWFKQRWGVCQCSCCKNVYGGDGWHYCPNCGAKMDANEE